MPAPNQSSKAILAIGCFLISATSAASYAAITLLFPGTILDRAWSLNPRAHAQLARLGWQVGLGFVLLALVLFIAMFGWFSRRKWAWRVTVAIVAAQMLGDFFNFFHGDHLGGSLGVLVAAFLLLCLFRRSVRSSFVT